MSSPPYIQMVKQITLRFSEEDFKRLENTKEQGKILGQWANWETFILIKCGIIK